MCCNNLGDRKKIKGDVVKKRGLLIILLAFCAVNSFAQDALKPRIAVFPLINPSADMQIDIISSNVKKTAELTLKMIDRYEVAEQEISGYENTESWFENYSVSNNIDSIIFGEAEMREDGSILLKMSVYSRADKAVIMNEEEVAETVFDIFEASDMLLISMIEEFSGMQHIGFGSIKVSNTGEEGRYSVYIDNVPVGENVSELPRILNGERSIRIEQERMLGSYTVLEEVFFLSEGETKGVEISIPGFTEGELIKIAPLENFINENWDSKYSSKKIDKNFEKLEELFILSDYSISASERKAELLERKQDWEKRKQDWGIDKGLSILDKRLGIAAYGGFLMSQPDFYTDYEGEAGNEISYRYGVSASLNLFKYLAVQTEYNYMEYRTKVERPLIEEITTINISEIPVILLLRMPNKVLSAYAGYNFQFKNGSAETEVTDIATGDKTYVNESNDEMVETEGAGVILGALFEIPLNRSFIMVDFRYAFSNDDWSKDPGEEVYPGYLSMVVGLGFKFF